MGKGEVDVKDNDSKPPWSSTCLAHKTPLQSSASHTHTDSKAKREMRGMGWGRRKVRGRERRKEGHGKTERSEKPTSVK